MTHKLELYGRPAGPYGVCAATTATEVGTWLSTRRNSRESNIGGSGDISRPPDRVAGPGAVDEAIMIAVAVPATLAPLLASALALEMSRHPLPFADLPVPGTTGTAPRPHPPERAHR